jgi:ribulose-5-phosphate 4-epimerase/fuculose-1-phosphate aldolase
MESLIKKYSDKLTAQNLCDPGTPLLGAIDDTIIWNRKSGLIPLLEEVTASLNINSIIFAPVKEPYKSIINYLSENSTFNNNTIYPDDTETRTFLHDIPVSTDFKPETISKALKKRKGIIIKDRGIVSWGTVSPEQAFVTFSSICFSCFVKFMTDFYYHTKGIISLPGNPEIIAASAAAIYENFISGIMDQPLIAGPFRSPDDTTSAIIEAGFLTVRSGMVDSFFGNISAKFDNTIYISQTGSSLDELAGAIDPCPLDNSTSNAITSSSEFSAHKSVYELSSAATILHGHPKFAVIMSMLCDDTDCANRGLCHINCSKERFMLDIPIVPGEVGTGSKGLARTLPPALKGKGGIVYGHGLFTTGAKDFREAFLNLLDIEKKAYMEYKKITGL